MLFLLLLLLLLPVGGANAHASNHAPQSGHDREGARDTRDTARDGAPPRDNSAPPPPPTTTARERGESTDRGESDSKSLRAVSSSFSQKSGEELKEAPSEEADSSSTKSDGAVTGGPSSAKSRSSDGRRAMVPLPEDLLPRRVVVATMVVVVTS